ncbi:MAG: hypothetical protein IK065_01680 [Neisseriaceae bacterium]|nr:hypothetical protein [Neisseriaceae bacterium]
MDNNAAISRQSEYIPYDIRASAMQVEPQLDIYWQEYLTDLFRNIPEQYKENIDKQVLRSKDITWNKKTQTFEYKGENSGGGESLLALVSSSDNNKMQMFGNQLVKYLDILSKSDNVVQIAEMLENAIQQIKDFDVGRNLSLQSIKYKLLRTFIYQAAHIVREKKANFHIPDNKRRINVDVCKTFINEVYLKQQLLEYSFKTLSHRQLLQFPYPLINQFLHKEQRVRKLHIVRTSRYLFAIAPSVEQSTNPYRVRRFLEESRLYSADSWVLTGSFIEFWRLGKEENPEIIQSMETQFRNHIEHIVSVESGISPILIEFFEKLEDRHQDQIFPLLFKPLGLERDLNEAIAEHLKVYEDHLEEYILNPLKDGLGSLLHNEDECNYAYIASQQLFSMMLNVFDSFMSLPLIMGNKVALRYYERLVAYAIFLTKRRNDIFVKQGYGSSGFLLEKEQAMKEGFLKCREIIGNVLPQYIAMQQEIEELQAQIDTPDTFLGKVFKKKARLEELHYEKTRQAHRMSYKAYQEMFSLPDKHQQCVVDLDFDAQLQDAENKCRYAFPDGENGLTKLPQLIVFAGSMGEFDLMKTAIQIAPEIVYEITGEEAE